VNEAAEATTVKAHDFWVDPVEDMATSTETRAFSRHVVGPGADSHLI
jgi:hypothetical protein